MELRGKVAVITGGAGAIGLAIGRRLGTEGMRIVLADVLGDRLEEAVAELRGEGLEVEGVTCDVTDLDSVRHLADQAMARFGAVQVVCNNAGTGAVSEGYLWEHDIADWHWGLDVNVLGVIHGIKVFVPLLVDQGEGHVINTSSSNGAFAPIGRGALGGPANAVYPMTKAAVLSLTESLYAHLQMAGSPVRASVLLPVGFLKTGIWESWRHRPEQYAPTQERQSPQQTLDAVVERFRAAGHAISFTPVERIAEQVADGLADGRFWMLGPPSPAEDAVAKRAESIRTRSQPDSYLVDVLSRSAAATTGNRAAS